MPTQTIPELPDETPALIENVPAHLLKGLRDYALHHIPTGCFLRSVLENNLYEAVCHADVNVSLPALRPIVIYVYNALPAPCWGSPEKVKAWLEERKQHAETC